MSETMLTVKTHDKVANLVNLSKQVNPVNLQASEGFLFDILAIAENLLTELLAQRGLTLEQARALRNEISASEQDTIQSELDEL